MKTAKFLAVQTICGAVLGWLIVLVLMAIAIPNTMNLMAPHAVIKSYESMAPLGRLVQSCKPFWAALGFLLPVVSWYFTARLINPNLPPFPFKSAPRPGFAWTTFVVAGFLFLWGLVLVLTHVGARLFSGFGARHYAADFFGWPLLGVFLCSAGWFVISPEGLAGNLSTWNSLSGEKRHGHVRALLAGLIFGLLAYGAAVYFDWMFYFLFVLITDVWVYSSEPAIGGIFRLMAALCLLGAAAGALMFSPVPALASEDPAPPARVKKAAPFFAVAALLALVSGGLYSLAAVRYDWRVQGLAEAARLEGEPIPEMTALFLVSKKKKKDIELKAWPLESSYWSYGSSGKVPASEENARVLKEFLAEKARTSRYRGAAVSALPGIFSVSWDPERIVDEYEEVSAIMGPEFGAPLIHAMSALAYLSSSAPATKENKKRLAAFSDPKRYYIPAKGALSLARGWRRMGEAKKAARWLKAAKVGGAAQKDIDEAKNFSGGKLFSGRVRGRIRLAGAKKIKIGLFKAEKGAMLTPYPGSTYTSGLVGSQWAGPNGSFNFRRIQDGEYGLGLLVDGKTISVDAKGVKVLRHPGIFKLSRARPAFDAGTITIKPGS